MNGCTASTAENVAQNTVTPDIAIAPPAILTCAITSVTLTASSTTTGATFDWGGGNTTATKAVSSPGSYSVTVTDPVNGCTASTAENVAQNTVTPDIAIAPPAILTCAITSVTLTASSTTTGATFDWGGGNTTATKAVSSPGSYSVTVTDPVNGCTASTAENVAQNTVTPDIAIAPPAILTCAITSVTLTASSTTTGATFDWGGGNTTATKAVSSPGSYSVTVTDPVNGCTAMATESVSTVSNLVLSETHVNILCYGGNNGSIDLSVNGGLPPYTITWNTGSLSEDLTGITAGNYSVTVTDNVGCFSSVNVNVTEPYVVQITSSVINVSCFGLSNGSVDLNVNGGVSPYVYQWNDNVLTEDRTNMVAGNYSVTVNDNNSCSSSVSIPITEPAVLNISGTHMDVACNSGNSGSINVTVAGGSAPYNYLWNDGVTSEDRSSLTTGNYSVTVFDNNSCSSNLSISVGNPAVLTVSETHSDILCFGGNNGGISINVNGGTAPYTYLWNDGITTQNRINLIEGTYSVSVTDSNLCEQSLTITIAQPSVLTVSENHFDVLCNGGNSGSATIITTGGTSPYTFAWNDGVMSSNRNGLSAGSYTATVSDNNACSLTVNLNIAQPPVINVSETHDNVLCYGGSTGNIDLTATGGVSPYSFVWNGGVTTEDRTGISAGNYFVTLTDNNQCTSALSISIIEPSPLNITYTHQNVACSGGNTGSIDITSTGGVSPYTYLWNDGLTLQDRSNLTIGSYSVTVSDNNFCTASLSVAIGSNAGIVITETHTDILCFGGNNGDINVNVTGGSAPYTYLWHDGIITQNRTNISSGIYRLSVTDNNSCIQPITINIAQPAELNVSENHINIVCGGQNSGSIALTVTGGFMPYTYIWNDGATIEDRNNLSAATYSVTITDNNSCSSMLSVPVTEPEALSITETHINVACSGGNTGSIDITSTGGVLPYTYLWNDGSPTEDRNSLALGNYSVTLSDNNLCTTSLNISIGSNAGIVITETHTDVLCFGGNDGSIIVNVSGGASPYSYLWNDGVITPNRTSVASGSYALSVSDNNACVQVLNVNISQPPAISISETHTDILCNGGSTGTINIASSGGIQPLLFVWNDGNTNQNRTNLIAGNYSVIVSDNNSCSSSLTVSITESAALSITETHTDVLCNGGSTASISVIVLNGTLPYTFIWNDNITTQNRVNIPAGNYSLAVTDYNSCSTGLVINISEPLMLNLTETHQNILCNGANTGLINVVTAGGVLPYSFAWNDGSNLQNRTGLSSGNYILTVSDNNQCTASLNVSLNQPSALNITETHVNILCNGANNGSIDVTSTGGTLPYTFIWNDAVIVDDRSNLLAGNYALTITDNNQCTSFLTVSVIEPASLSISETHVDVACGGATPGSIDISSSGGTAPYSYLWNDGITTQNRNNLPSGIYHLTVQDNNLCTSAISVNILLNLGLNLNENHTNVLCYGNSNGAINVSAAGGSSPYTFVWSDGSPLQNRANLSIGTYSVTASDVNSCSSSLSVVITGPAALNVTEAHTDILCNGSSTAAINISPSGGTSPYTFLWNDGNINQNRTTLSAGNYSVTVLDNNSCSSSVGVNISEPSAFSVSAIRNNIPCNGGNIGSIVIAPSGGTAPYTYTWNDGNTSQNRNFLSAGTYSLTVNDNNNCTFSITTQITQPSVLNVIETHSDVLCAGNSNGTINLSVSGGTSPYTFAWNDGNTQQNRTGISAGNYTVTISDNNLCSITLPVAITEPTELIADETHVDVLCYGASTGSINISLSGGTSPYLFNWNDGNTYQNRLNLTAGNYSVTVSDDNSCSLAITVSIPQPTALIISETHANLLCNGANTGSVSVSSTGGTLPYTYIWNDGNTSPIRNNLNAGSYLVTVNDNNSCSSGLNIVITEPATLNISETHVNVSCYGGNSGSIDITSAGGVSPYTYLWNDGTATEDRSSLVLGSYIVTVTDNNSCTSSLNVAVGTNSGILITETHTNVLCFGGNNADISVSVSGGVSPYTYLWNDGAALQNRTGIGAGTYTLSVTDNSLCVQLLNITISEPAILNVGVTTANVLCHGQATGSINLVPSGGTSPYNFVWNSGTTTPNRNSLSAGNYQVTITDNHTCSSALNVNITEPPAISLTATHTDVLCNSANTGSINIAVSGGVSPYYFIWNGGVNTEDRVNIAAGNYSVTVSDNNSCTSSLSVSITQPAPLELNESHTHILCYGASTGYVNLTVSGGTIPYSFGWNTGSVLQNLTNVSAGNYSVTVTDNNGCSVMQNGIILTEPTAITASEVHTNVSCNGYNDGNITTSVSGGVSPYAFVWNDGNILQNRNNLAAGTYSVSITDNNSCPVTISAVITEPAGVLLGSSFINPTCEMNPDDGSISLNVSGGAIPYQFSWSHGTSASNLTGLGPGNYIVTLTDANGCSLSSSFTLSYQYDFSVDASPSVTISLGESTTLGYTITGNPGNYTSIWAPSSTLSCTGCINPEASPSVTTVYNIQVTNEAGCTASDAVTVYITTDYTIFVPNVFTPNGDGNNDYFEVFGKLKGVAFFEIQVFNRWGEKVYESNNYQFKWDGTYKGVLQNPAVFVWQLRLGFLDGHVEDIRKGSVTLIR